ncbi:MAG: putative rane-associated protein [Acidimicrobiales bacterium]|nr:putative rane-associated protein [Acidimicrobiales bacterium]
MLALFNIESWLENGGLVLLAAIIFAESGLLIGFFLPGDSLLFIAGIFTVGHDSKLPALPITALIVVIAAIAGDQVGYLFGRKVGPSLFQRPESKLFKPAHVERAHAFLEAHGTKTIVMARFVPVVRTFAPIVAGVGRMKYRTFVTFNVIGGLLWGAGVTTLGHFLGNVTWVKNNIELASVGIIAISLIPVAIEVLKHRRESAKVVETVGE